MPHKITYYAIVGGNRTVDNPYGLVRRLEHDDGPADEGLGRDFSWDFTPVIVEWEHGSLMTSLSRLAMSKLARSLSISADGGGLRGGRLGLDRVLLIGAQVTAERARPHERGELLDSELRYRERRI